MKKHVMDQKSVNNVKRVSRRHFVKMAGITALGVSSFGISEFYPKGVSIILDPADLIAGSPPSQWAVKELEESLNYYKKARSFWTELANRARDVYKPDITVGENAVIRGHWLDRLPAIDEDIAFMANLLEQPQSSVVTQQDNVRLAILESKGRPMRASGVCHHIRPKGFRAGQPLDIELSFEKTPASARLYYRHVNHAERYETKEMQLLDNRYKATIPATYTDSIYPIQYYIELKDVPDKAWLYPGFMPDLANQPYFVVHKT